MDLPPYILNSQGRIHAVYELNLPDERTGVKIFYSQSDDNGATWSDRSYLSSPEIGPPYFDSQYPSAYADDEGHIVAAWFDFQYGSMCGETGDILARVSTDNGTSWKPETRLTYTQSGYSSSCLILNGIIYIVWKDSYLFGCLYPKLMLSSSSDWGENWSKPELITPNEAAKEGLPYLFWDVSGNDTLIHCAYTLAPLIPGNSMIYYVRNMPFYSKSMPIQNDQEAILNIGVSHAAINSTAMISYKNSEGNEAVLPDEQTLSAYPNPFNSATTITLTGAEQAEIGIYDITGRLITTLHTVGGQALWDASAYSSGLYFARVQGRRRAR